MHLERDILVVVESSEKDCYEMTGSQKKNSLPFVLVLIVFFCLAFISVEPDLATAAKKSPAPTSSSSSEDGGFLLLIGCLVGAVVLGVYILKFRDYSLPCSSCGKRYVPKVSSLQCRQCNEKLLEQRRRDEEQHRLEALRREEQSRQEQERYAEEMARAAKQRKEAWARDRSELSEQRKLSGQQYEQLVGTVFERQGYMVRYTPASGDGGVDIFLENKGRQEIVQCKNREDSVGIEEVQRLYGVFAHHRAQRAYLITTSKFTAAAKDFAKNKDNLVLVDGPAFLIMMAQAGLRGEANRNIGEVKNSAQNDWIIIFCIRENCKTRLRIPSGKNLEVKCPTCGTKFFWDYRSCQRRFLPV